MTPELERLLDATFPFHLLVSERLLLRGYGRSAPRLMPGLAVGDPLELHVGTIPAGPPLTVEHLLGGRTRALALSALTQGVMLRCQVVPGEDGTLLLLTSPWLGDSRDLDRAGLSLNDFAPHDASPDYVFVSQGQLTALADARRLAERLRTMEAERRDQALHDPLTGAGNRRRFTEHLAVVGSGTGLLLVDIDDFKGINDTYGHHVGDAVLHAVASRLDALAGPEDVVCRIGGDEFAVLLPGPWAAERAEELGRDTLDAIREPVVVEGRSITATVSMGIVAAGDPAVLVRNADVALYSAKRAGRGHAVVFDAALHEALLYRMELRDRLERAVADGAITLVYQPIVRLDTGAVHGFEALSRWTDPVLGPIRPDVFIALAEETGLVGRLGLFVLQEGARQLAAWRARHPGADLQMSVNLAPRQLDDPEIATRVREALDANQLPPHALQLELTESAFTARGGAAEQLDRLHALGVPLAIDDFGSSESTLARLHAVPASVLKIDRAFLEDLQTAPERSTRLLRAVVAIADALELRTVAEGIETEEHRHAVVNAGCTYGQGFLWARPMPPEQAQDWLDRQVPAPGPVPPQRPVPRKGSAPRKRSAPREGSTESIEVL